MARSVRAPSPPMPGKSVVLSGQYLRFSSALRQRGKKDSVAFDDFASRSTYVSGSIASLGDVFYLSASVIETKRWEGQQIHEFVCRLPPAKPFF